MLQVRNSSQKLAEVQHCSSVKSGICFTKPLPGAASGACSSLPSLFSPPALGRGGGSLGGPLAPGPSCLLLLFSDPGICIGACPASVHCKAYKRCSKFRQCKTMSAVISYQTGFAAIIAHLYSQIKGALLTCSKGDDITHLLCFATHDSYLAGFDCKFGYQQFE